VENIEKRTVNELGYYDWLKVTAELMK